MKQLQKQEESLKSGASVLVASPFGGGREEAGARISIQGYEGSFHQVAARQFFGKDVEVIPCATFREVVKIAAAKKENGDREFDSRKHFAQL